MPVHDPGDRYPLVVIEGPDDWLELLDLCDGHLGEDDLEKLRDCLAGSCKSVVVERDYVCKDYRDTYTNYYAKKFATYPAKCTRLLFFDKRIPPDDWWDVPSYAGGFIGYSVIRPTRINSIGRTILKPEACDGARGFVCRTRFTANLMGTELEVRGFPHISQDTDVTVCAHAACWGCFRYFTERYPTYREIYPYQITQLTTDLSGGRLLPSRGLWMEQVVEMFSRFGFYPRIYFRKEVEHFDRLLYYYVESGLPLVAGIEPDHAITAIGHTCDLGVAPPAARAFSDHYLTGLVVNDDNGMPYETLPRDDQVARFSGARRVSDYRMSQIDSFVVPLYEKVYLAAEDVEGATLELLEDPHVGVAAISSLPPDELVIRIFLTTSRAYKAQRRSSPLPYDLARLYTRLPMPKFIWVAELSTRQLYPQEQILGEIIWDATASDGDLFSWLVVHYPERILVNDRSSDSAPITERVFPTAQPYGLYKHNLHPVG